MMSTEDTARLIRLLTNTSAIPASNFEIANLKGTRYVSVPDLFHFLSHLEAETISDQKQEAYKGLREYLHLALNKDGIR